MHGDIQEYQTVNSIVLNSAQTFYTNPFPSIEIGIIMAPNRRRVDLEGRGMKRGDVSPPTDKRTPSSETGISESWQPPPSSSVQSLSSGFYNLFFLGVILLLFISYF